MCRPKMLIRAKKYVPKLALSLVYLTYILTSITLFTFNFNLALSVVYLTYILTSITLLT